ncbi:complement C3a receptor 1 L homeolog [Xenopus laevis]|uniref:C3aR n=1 Tax=Xenopus laevis TaxID=8355 RepID=G8IG87_XENLA|nr:complement C3a receptor 1 L homeolog [Xenopus laevis]AER23668.1 C3aR [Xenopus laevis]
MEHYSPESMVILIVMAVTFIVGVPGNILVIWVTGIKMRRTVNTVWFCNLAVADLICCLSLPFSIANELLHYKWPSDLVSCKLLPSIIILNMFASVFTLVAISVDRFILVVKPVWAQNHRSVLLAYLLCLFIWLVSLLLCLPVFMYRTSVLDGNHTYCSYNYNDQEEDQEEDADYNFSEEGYGNEYGGHYSHDEPSGPHPTSVSITITRAVFGFFLPLLIILFCYVRLTGKVQSGRFAKVGRKTRKVVIAIVLAFGVLWAPYHIIGIALEFSASSVLSRLDHFSQALAYSNSCLNPVLYVFMGKDFKSKMSQSIRGLLESALSDEATRSTGASKSRESARYSSML